ncbi:hypothetical protein BH10PSE19_BH10PSE19_00080 [soil metagenome]
MNINTLTWKNILIGVVIASGTLTLINFIFFGWIFHGARQQVENMAKQHQAHFEQREKEIHAVHTKMADDFDISRDKQITDMKKKLEQMEQDAHIFANKYNVQRADSYCTFQDKETKKIHDTWIFSVIYGKKSLDADTLVYKNARAHCICRVLVANNPVSKSCEKIILSGSFDTDPKNADDILLADPTLKKEFENNKSAKNRTNKINESIQGISNDLH